jgi:hypothetical protein
MHYAWHVTLGQKQVMMTASPAGVPGATGEGTFLMGITSRWGRARTVAVAGGAVASGMLLLAGAAPAGASASTVAPKVVAKYACSAKIPVIGTKSWSGTITVLGASTKTVAPGGAVSIAGWQAQVTIPKALVDEAGAYASSIGGKLATFTINATDAKVKGVNAAGKGITVPTVKISKTSPALTFKIPATPTTVKGWTAGTKGSMVFSTGNAVLDLTADTIIGNEAVTVTCIATPATLSTTTVS